MAATTRTAIKPAAKRHTILRWPGFFIFSTYPDRSAAAKQSSSPPSPILPRLTNPATQPAPPTSSYAHRVPGHLQAQIGRQPDPNNAHSQELGLERETGFEPATLSLGKFESGIAGGHKASQAVVTTRSASDVPFQRTPPEATIRKDFASPLLPDSSASLTVRGSRGPHARLHRNGLPPLHHRRAAPLPRRRRDSHPGAGSRRVPSQVTLLLSLEPLQQRSRGQHIDAKVPRKVAQVAGNQRVGPAGEGYLEERQ